MSLINDALKRANQKQPPVEPPAGGGDSGAPMRPVDPRQRPGSGSSPLTIGLIVLVLMLSGILFYLAGRSSARTPAPDSTLAVRTTTATQAVAVVQATGFNQTNPTPPATNIAVTLPKPLETVVVTTPPPVLVTQVVVITSNVPAPVPPALRLQGILYSPTRPSAVINGKTVFIGERVGDARVLAISQTSVTLLQGGQTNVISLPE